MKQSILRNRGVVWSVVVLQVPRGFRVKLEVRTKWRVGKDCDACLEPKLSIRSSNAALRQKRNISDSGGFVESVKRTYTPYSFELCVMEKR